ncbi:FKBP-type peptidyl-prolyl cis-trans isomerase [Cellulomonas denverensis]|uniref:Peptidyl-prolyl cis-trans isomerase n=1 Tax=Cellulomonas denverensis TaxID=264297 RepID=A0A7X6KTT0_9CELL|nr:FKBP-type peptidyl-prolyl cis-trans isomerase [Cellulomonas denverensis]NKY22112.1 FKBP-type peptidyl-prolyl cis-trans isomerase [Cellulomonas denverensis]GIG26127.1 peptidylprolyl isomerase [Cellulomonas denverensis]
MRRIVALCAAAVLLLAGCGDNTPEDPEVVVTGDVGGTPTITYRTPLQVSETTRETVWEGTGPELVDGRPVLLDFWLENAKDASLVKESYTSSPTPRMLTEEDLGKDLYATLSGQKVGARLVQIAPAASNAASSYPTVTVLDVLPTRASGEAVAPREGMPTVTLGEDGAPTITATGTEPPGDLTVQPLIRGNGRQVAENDVITVQYSGFIWADGQEVDSTWTSGSPQTFTLSDVPAWSEALLEQSVGSQVMVVVPPSYALGVTQSEEFAGQTVVFVIDLLATRSPAATPTDGATEGE